MNLIFLPGNSSLTREWAHSICDKLSDRFGASEVLEYLHWEEKGGPADLESEVKRFHKIVENKDGDYVVMAKSMGVVVFLEAQAGLKKRPKALVFIGSPFAPGRERTARMIKVLSGLKEPVFFIQEKEDPICNYAELSNQLKDQERAIAEVPGTGHAYTDLDKLVSLVGDWLESLH